MSLSLTGPQLAVETCRRRLRLLDGFGPSRPDDARICWYGPARVPADRPGSEATVQALGGLMEVNGRDSGTPVRLGIEAASVAAGLLAAQGILAAGIAGDRGHPRSVHTSVLQAGLLLLSHYFVVATGLGDAVPGPPLPAPGPPFRSADGYWFEIETLDAEPWRDFWTLLGAADADLGRGWTVFRWRYERATCSLPVGLHEAAARCSLAELRRVAADAEVSLMPLRAYTDVLAVPGLGAAHPTVRSRHGGGPCPNPPGDRRETAASRASDADLPLAGFRVVEATSRIQGPFAGMLLRMLGAEVTRVQPPEGDYGRAALGLHRGKDTVRLDLGAASGRSHLVDLMAGADVFLHNWRPGKAAEWGLEFDDLAPRFPRLVYANASGWGGQPEAHHLVGTDFLVQAYAGLGEGLNPQGEPAFPSRMILSDLFGALVGAEGVLAALSRRERDGCAWEVRSSLLAGAMALQAHVLEGFASGQERGRRGGRPVWGPLDHPVPTADGTLVLSAEGDDALRRASEACGLSTGATRRVDDEERLAARLGGGPARTWEDVLLAAGVPCAVACEDLAAIPADPRFSELFEPVGIGGLAPRSPWAFG